MPIGYVIALVLFGMCTLAALTPPGRMSMRRFVLAVGINEVPYVAALLLVLTTALAWSEGDLVGWTGLALAVVAGVIFLALVELTRRCFLAGPAVEAALRRHDVVPDKRSWHRVLRPLLFPFPRRPRSVKRTGPIFYGDHRRQRLDVYRPKNGGSGSGPVLVYLHGGGYFTGSNRWEARALLHRLAARGWICISASYRVRPSADFTDHLDDARAALRWAHDHAEAYGGDPRKLAMAGSSAGAHLTALCALTQEPSNPARPRVDAAVCLYGYYGRYYGRGPGESPVSTPLALDPAQAPPFFLAHGDHDSYASVVDARALSDHLATSSRSDTWYVELPGAQHGFDALLSWRFAVLIPAIEEFLDRA